MRNDSMRLGHEFFFDAAHHLPGHRGKCKQLHGHTYKLEIVIEGDLQHDGMVLDFSRIKEIVKREVLDKLDHQQLNDVVVNPTAEHLVNWIYEQLKEKLPVSSIKLWEGNDKWVEKTTSV